MQGQAYVLFLLKNYRRLKAELEFLKQRASGQAEETPQLTGLLGVVFAAAYTRHSNISQAELTRAVEILEKELTDLEQAMTLLPAIQRGVIKDIYLNGVTWIAVTHKWHISEATISRYRKKALTTIWHHLSRGLSFACNEVIECVESRAITTTNK